MSHSFLLISCAFQWTGYFRFVAQYTGDKMDVRIPPELIDRVCEYVELWHNESSFHANDHQSAYWLKTGQQVLKKKERGCVIMVSDFLVEYPDSDPAWECELEDLDCSSKLRAGIELSQPTGREGFRTHLFNHLFHVPPRISARSR